MIMHFRRFLIAVTLGTATAVPPDAAESPNMVLI